MNTVQTRAQTLAGEECHLHKIKEFDKMKLQLKIGQMPGIFKTEEDLKLLLLRYEDSMILSLFTLYIRFEISTS